MGMKELPDDLEAVEVEEIANQGLVRDERIAPLFRRWPKLNRDEMRQLKAMYTERVRIARHLGRLRRRGTTPER